jgi:hypothetical protein
MLLICVTLTSCLADDAAEQGTITDPAKGGPDFAVQGEYVGMLGPAGDQQKWGLQVIALGDHKFDAVAYPGGLPGDGWTGEEKIHSSGQTKDGVTKLEAEGKGHAIISDGVARVVAVEHGEIGSLKKVERKSPTLGAAPPENALVLFDGSTAEHFERGKIVMDNLLAADCETKQKFGDHVLHLEFRTPFKPAARGQARGNSGVYLQGRYECQVLDSFGLEGRNNECGGIYSIAEPNVNAAFPPLSWQTYDIEFTAAKFENGKKVTNARATIRHNGILIHDDLELPHGTPGKYPEGEGPESIYLQGHGNPVVYRNVWIVEK